MQIFAIIYLSSVLAPSPTSIVSEPTETTPVPLGTSSISPLDKDINLYPFTSKLPPNCGEESASNEFNLPFNCV